MTHLPQIIQDLALILVVAAVVSLIFKKLKQPVVLGYLVAGMLVGPHQPYFPSVIDHAGISIWAEIGVIFLLFAIGLEFSFRKLMSVGASAGITAVFQISVMVFLGFVAGQVSGWDWMSSLFLGAVISISSTTILVKTFDELGLKGRRFVSLVVGILIFEDLAAVLMMVLLSTLAISREFQGIQLIEQFSRLIFFLCLWFMVGVFVLPNLVKRIRFLLNPEATVIVSLGLCFLMVVLATKAGFSPALGAFIMGSLLAETSEGERIEHVTRSVKDLFSAIFFVSVGMLIDPLVLVDHWELVLLFSLVVVLGKVFSVTFGSLISGQNLKTSIQTGLSLAQIGEFSYIIAGLGLSLKVTNELLYPLAVAISIVTAFITPYMVKGADGIYSVLEKFMPVKVRKALDSYSLLPTSGSMTTRREYLKNFSLKMLLNTVIIIAIFLSISQGVRPWLQEKMGGEVLRVSFGISVTLFLSAPFFWALVFSKVEGYSFSMIWKNRGARSSILFLSLFRIVWGVILLVALITQFIPQFFYAVLVLLAVTICMFLFYSVLEKLYGSIESRFLINLHRKGIEEKEQQLKKAQDTEMPPLAPWDAHLVEFEVPQDANYVGSPLESLSIREKYGVTIALIRRGGRRITAPGRNEMLMPLDHIFVIGTDEQLLKFKKFLDFEKALVDISGVNRDYSLEQYLVTEKSPFVGKTIRLSGLREATKGIVVGIERQGKRILNPDSALIIETGDLLWIVGDRRLIRTLEL
ncbi:cation:proton antiporter [Bdellovibrio sp. HCB337]|uniref:cation:proton antiporter domain-containing protein n=1 Tax=Bdellovibrio sp. HCB337 TaxID=3394358 RepID=UPI0039A5B131